jgi:hypothetical protein
MFDLQGPRDLAAPRTCGCVVDVEEGVKITAEDH